MRNLSFRPKTAEEVVKLIDCTPSLREELLSILETRAQGLMGDFGLGQNIDILLERAFSQTAQDFTETSGAI